MTKGRGVRVSRTLKMEFDRIGQAAANSDWQRQQVVRDQLENSIRRENELLGPPRSKLYHRRIDIWPHRRESARCLFFAELAVQGLATVAKYACSISPRESEQTVI